jgi:hypothetical protein
MSGAAIDIAYGYTTATSGRWVAISSTGASCYSVNGGVSWVAGGALPAATYSCMTYGQGRWVALSTGDTINAYSTDGGVTWAAGTALPDSTTWTSIVYGANKFVAVSSSGTVNPAYSVDGGLNWSNTGAAGYLGTGTITDVRYGQGVFVVTTSSSNNMSSSEDGINWTTYSIGSSASYARLTYGNGKFIAVQGSNVGDSHYYSTDGINWNSVSVSNTNWLLGYGDTTIEIQTEIGGQGESGTAEILAPVATYTTPALKTAKVVKVEITNLNNTQLTYDLAKLSSGQTLDEYNSTVWDKALAGNSIDVLNNTFDMISADSITVLPSTVDSVNVKVYGVEEIV